MQFAKLLIDRRINGLSPDGHPCHMLLPIPFDENGVKVEIIQCSVLTKGAGCSLIKITDFDGTHKDAITQNHMSNLMGECAVMKMSRNKYLATVMNNNCMLAEILSESGCFLTSAVPRNDDEIEWTLFAPNGTYITNLVKRMKSEGYGAMKVSSQNMNVEATLTDKQDEVITYAFENGYYDIPKKISTEELCDKFDCSKSTMSVILRGAEKKLISLYLTMNRDLQKYN